MKISLFIEKFQPFLKSIGDYAKSFWASFILFAGARREHSIVSPLTMPRMTQACIDIIWLKTTLARKNSSYKYLCF